MEAQIPGMSDTFHQGTFSEDTLTSSVAMGRHGLFLCNAAGFLFAFKACVTFLWFQSDPKLGAAVEVGATLAWLAIAICYTALNPPQPVHRFVGVRPVRWIFAYLGLAAISLLWTSAKSLNVAAAY